MSDEAVLAVLIAALSLAVLLVAVRWARRARKTRVEGVRVTKRAIGTSWYVTLSHPAVPRGLSVGRSPDGAIAVAIREGLSAWGADAARCLGEGATLRAAWAEAEGEWTLEGGALRSWVRDARGPLAAKRVEARVSEGLALMRRLREAAGA